MFSLDRWREIADTLTRNKLRTALTMLAMSWGIFMLVVLLGLGRGLQNGVLTGFADDALNSVWIWTGQTSLPHDGLPPGRRVQLANADADRTRALPQVEHVTGRFFLPGDEVEVRNGDKVSSFEVRSTHPDHLYLENTLLVGGRFLNDEDLARQRKVCVIGLPVAEFLFGRRDVVGEWVMVSDVAFRVVGVFDDEGGEGEQRKVYLPITTAQAAFNGADRMQMLMFTVGDATVEETKRITGEVKAALAKAHDFAPGDPQAVRVRDNVEGFERFRRIFSMIDLFIWLMGGCTIVAGVVGVSNIMMIIVRERTKEIGIRKALGATPRDIVGTILQESIVMTSFAGYLGLVAGVGLLELASAVVPKNDMFHHPRVDLGVALAAVAVLVVSGTVAGYFPARAAARVNPIVALRDE